MPAEATFMCRQRRLDVIQKYADSQAKRPETGTNWGRREWAYQDKSTQCSKNIAKIWCSSMRRDSGRGFCYGEDTIWQKEFEETFPFDETDDQLEAIEAVKHDMESNKIMDRLICGDVGYGKTKWRSVRHSRRHRRANRWYFWCRRPSLPSSIIIISSRG